jgi:hypothetical protein
LAGDRQVVEDALHVVVRDDMQRAAPQRQRDSARWRTVFREEGRFFVCFKVPHRNYWWLILVSVLICLALSVISDDMLKG